MKKVCVIGVDWSIHIRTWHELMKKVMPEVEIEVFPNTGVPEGKFDFYHVKGPAYVRVAETVPKPFVFSAWGMLRTEGERIPVQDEIARRANIITHTNPQVLDDYAQRYRFRKKMMIARYTSNIQQHLLSYPLYDNYEITKDAVKILLGYPLNRKVVAIGHACRRYHNHLKVIRQIQDIDCFPVVHLSRPVRRRKQKGYIREVTKALKGRGKVDIAGKTLEEMALFRYAADIMIHVPERDLLSNSMLEHLQARNVVIAASWLRLDEIRKKGYMEEVLSFDEIPSKLNEVIQDWDNRFAKTAKNVEFVKETLDPVTAGQQWKAVYEAML